VVRISFNVMGTSRRGDSSVAEQVAGRKRGPCVHSCSAPTCRLIEFWSISPSRVQCSASSTPDKRSTARDRHTRGRRRPYRKNQLESGESPMLDQFSRFTFALLLASLAGCAGSAAKQGGAAAPAGAPAGAPSSEFDPQSFYGRELQALPKQA